MTITDLRSKIDKIDLEIIKLLGARTKLVEQVGFLKKNSSKIKDSRREKQIIRRLKKQAQEQGLDPELVERIYVQLFDYFVNYQNQQNNSPK